jgi:hypothetical protein
MALITSVEYVEIEIGAGETTDSADLTKSQTIAKCVPFLTCLILGQSSEFDRILLDVEVEAGPIVTVTRTTAGGTISVGVTVVEFGTDATIQSGAFAMANTEGSDTVDIDAVTESKSVLVCNYRTNGVGNTKWGPACVRAKFNTSSQLIFERDDTTGAIAGHWFVFECNGTEFSVQRIAHVIAASATEKTTTIDAITANKTFLISTFKTVGSNDDTENYSHSVKLASTTTLYSQRGYAKNESVDTHVFVISFSDSQIVQRGTFNYANDSTQETDTISTVSTTWAMPWNPNRQGLIQTEGSSAGDIESAWNRVKLASTTQVQGDKTAGQVSIGEWEVVEWAIEPADWLSTWKYRRKVTVSTANIDSNLTHFPVSLKLGASVGIGSDDVTSIFDELGANSKKFAVTKSDGTTQIYCEIEKWDNGGEQAWLWVSKDDLVLSSTASTDLYFYYDSSKSDNTTYVGNTKGATPVSSVWDSDFIAIYHMNETTGAIKDSTINGHDAGTTDVTVQGSAAGLVDGACDFEASNTDYVSITEHNDFDITTAITLEACVKAESIGDWERIVCKSHTTNEEPYSMYGLMWDNALHVDFELGISSTSKAVSGALEHQTGVNYCVAGTYDGTDQVVYTDGAVDGTGLQSGSIDTNNVEPSIGRSNYGTPNDFFDGIIDEVRISKIKRTTDWLKANNKNLRDDFVNWGSEEQYSKVRRIFIFS